MTKLATARAVADGVTSSGGKTRRKAVKPKPAEANAPCAEQAVATAREPSHEQIAEHAYALYLARGAGEGGAFGDWLSAEAVLRAS